MVENIFKGLGIALITPFTPDGMVDYNSLRHLLEYQIAEGADFLCILATTGEVPCLTAEEKDRITTLVKDVNKGRLPILWWQQHRRCHRGDAAVRLEWY